LELFLSPRLLFFPLCMVPLYFPHLESSWHQLLNVQPGVISYTYILIPYTQGGTFLFWKICFYFLKSIYFIQHFLYVYVGTEEENDLCQFHLTCCWKFTTLSTFFLCRNGSFRSISIHTHTHTAHTHTHTMHNWEFYPKYWCLI
jgi:hypothetical protein